MSLLLFESICLRDGVFERLSFHQSRLERSIHAGAQPLNLETILYAHILPQEGLHKVKLIYSADAEFIGLESAPYVKRSVPSLVLTESAHLDYSKKYMDRGVLEALCRHEQSEVLITQHGWLTDTSYSNIALWDGSRWVTPSHCLLLGTKREYLLETGALCATPIHRDNLHEYESCCLINAMLDLGELILPISSLRLSGCDGRM